MKDRGTRATDLKKTKIKIKSCRILYLAFLQHRLVLVIPERTISMASVGKNFTEKQNIL